MCRSTAGLRPIVLIALAAPLALSACATSQTSTKTAAIAPPSTGAAVDAYGYAPVRITAFSDGSRIALPSQKPDAAKLASTPPEVAPGAASAANGELAGKSSRPSSDAAALAADVAERKASTVSSAIVAPASDALAAKAAASALASRPSASDQIAAAAAALNPVEVVPATIEAVGKTASAVTTAAVETTAAVTTAAAETTAKAYDAVTERIGDTFRGDDTITGSASIDRMIETAAAENNIPSELAYAVVRVESHYNPRAKGSGVYGLSQIQPATARSLGFSGSPDDLYDPETNLRYGMKYLAGAWQKSGGDICGAAMKYKGGHRTTHLSRSAATYCANVKRHMAAIERRRAPANRETVVAATERQKQITVASNSRPVSRALPGVEPASVIAASPIAAPLMAAAASPSGRSVAASAVPVTSAALGASIAAPGESRDVRGARVVRASAPVTSVLGLAE